MHIAHDSTDEMKITDHALWHALLNSSCSGGDSKLAMTAGAQRFGELTSVLLQRTACVLHTCNEESARVALVELTSTLSAAHHMQLQVELCTLLKSATPAPAPLLAYATK